MSATKLSYKEATRRRDDAAREWKGGYRHYDIIKEGSIALGVVCALALILTILFSSPDEKPLTLRGWARTDPVDFVTTATSELDGSSVTATYGPPYNSASSGQRILFIHLAKWFGIAHPINTAQDYVIAPLRQVYGDSTLQAAVTTYVHASAKQQTAWTTAYSGALAKASTGPGDSVSMKAGTYGPVQTMMTGLLRYAQSGGLDGALLTNPQFYATDYTKILMFLADGGLIANQAEADHLGGDQWGMMNETGSFPGQSWLWLYTFWYQIKPFSTSPNADVLVMAVMGLMSTLFILVPFLPGVRDLPRKIPIYKLIWREHYRSLGTP
jgi:hypothetical protein